MTNDKPIAGETTIVQPPVTDRQEPSFVGSSDDRGRHWPFLILLAILLVAFALRAWNLTGAPPGLTHDEANHGREAIGILNGIYLYFFPLNYGSEPLYSYTVALFMALLGRGVLALRLVNVVFGTAAVAMTYVWASPRLSRATALLGAALVAVSFWPLAASREALRAGMLPFFMTLAVWAFWRLLEVTSYENRVRSAPHSSFRRTTGVVVRNLKWGPNHEAVCVVFDRCTGGTDDGYGGHGRGATAQPDGDRDPTSSPSVAPGAAGTRRALFARSV